MDVRHTDDDLERLELDPEYRTKLAPPVLRAFRKVLLIIRTVENETKLRDYRSLNFEKLKGERDHQWSLRLNDQWRLIVELEEGEQGNVVVVQGIEDYH